MKKNYIRFLAALFFLPLLYQCGDYLIYKIGASNHILDILLDAVSCISYLLIIIGLLSSKKSIIFIGTLLNFLGCLVLNAFFVFNTFFVAKDFGYFIYMANIIVPIIINLVVYLILMLAVLAPNAGIVFGIIAAVLVIIKAIVVNVVFIGMPVPRLLKVSFVYFNQFCNIIAPMLGSILLGISVYNMNKNKKFLIQKAIVESNTNNDSGNVIDKLMSLKNLYEKGIITKEEMEEKKNKLLVN